MKTCYDKIMEWVSRHILLAPLMIIFVTVGICSCRTQKVVVAEKETTTVTVHEREVPVFTPQIDVNAKGKIWIDPNGFPKLGDIDVTTNSEKPHPKQPKVNVELDSLGNLNIDVVIPEDTTNVSVSDTTKNTIKDNTHFVEVEKENPWWKKMLMFFGFFAIMIIIGILGLRIINK